MKTIKVLFRSIALGLGLLAATAFGDYTYVHVDYSDSPPWNNGTVYNVPAGANYDWEVEGSAQIIVGGGGLNVNHSGSFAGDVGNTAYADNISYELDAYGTGGSAYLYLGW